MDSEVWSIVFTYSDLQGVAVQQETFRSTYLEAFKVSADIKFRIEGLGMKFYWSQVREITPELATLTDYFYEEAVIH